MVEDEFPDEVCLVIEDVKGLIVIAGCSHPGILNMIESVRERFGKPVYAVLAVPIWWRQMRRDLRKP